MLQQNFSRPHITNVMENVANFLQFCLAVIAIGNEYLYRKHDFSIPTELKFPASSKSVHRLGNRWDIKKCLFVVTFIVSYICMRS